MEVMRTLLIVLLLVPSVIFGQVVLPMDTVHYRQRLMAFSLDPIDPEDTVMIGDSLTELGDWSLIFDDPNIENRGIGSDISIGLYYRLDTLLMGQPRKIFILVGINDLIPLNSPVEHVIKTMERIVWKIQKYSPKSKLYIQSLLPVNADFPLLVNLPDSEDKILQFNQSLKRLSRKKGFTYIDLYSAFKQRNFDKLRSEYTTDGIHLSNKGYEVWTKVLRPYISE